jgi:hypothetical protein
MSAIILQLKAVSYSFEDEFSNVEYEHQWALHLTALRDMHPVQVLLRQFKRDVGKVREVPQKRTNAVSSALVVRDSKVAGFDLTRNYRESYGLLPRTAFCSIMNLRGVDTNSHAEDHIQCREDQAGSCDGAAAGKPGCPPRLGALGGICTCDVDDAAAAEPG